MKKHIDKITHTIHHHTRTTVHAVRTKPYPVRMQLIRLCTFIGSLCIVILWVTLLKRQLQIDPVVQKKEIEKGQVISEGIWKVYDKAKDPNQQEQ